MDNGGATMRVSRTPPRWIAAVSFVVAFVLLERWAAVPLGFVTTGPANAMPWPLSSFFVALPGMAIGALLGWPAARERFPLAHVAAGAPAMVVARLLARWVLGSTYVAFDARLVVEIAIDTLSIAAACIAAYWLARRSHAVPGTPANIVLPLTAGLLAATFIVVTPLRIALIAAFAMLEPGTTVPVAAAWAAWPTVLAWGAIGYAAKRWGWVGSWVATACVGYACLVHIGLWILGNGDGDAAVAAFTWAPVAAMPLSFAGGWWLAARRRMAPPAAA